MEYHISLTESARADLKHFTIRDQRVVAAGIMAHLRRDAEVITRKKKRLRANPLAPWELRIDRFRVFYTIEEGFAVKIVAVGVKVHNQLIIRSKRVEL